MARPALSHAQGATESRDGRRSKCPRLKCLVLSPPRVYSLLTKMCRFVPMQQWCVGGAREWAGRLVSCVQLLRCGLKLVFPSEPHWRQASPRRQHKFPRRQLERPRPQQTFLRRQQVPCNPAQFLGVCAGPKMGCRYPTKLLARRAAAHARTYRVFRDSDHLRATSESVHRQ